MATTAVMTWWGVTGKLVEARLRVFVPEMPSAILTYVETVDEGAVAARAAADDRVWDESDICAEVLAKTPKHMPLAKVIDRLSIEGITLLCEEPYPIELSQKELDEFLPIYRPELIIRPVVLSKEQQLAALQAQLVQAESDVAELKTAIAAQA